ncbi:MULTISPECIES: O-antigen ligase family protein [unclassified Cellulophaga]|uniref:O-antigen ligase family protein n=1 Tax=unclassified Cellulophaga TaxID=2634405 RepID=UPI0026E340F4|nr:MULTISPECIES: O-antigen ligase family protein [unclassified Cellulophaga]MDO6489763.1 O-antigen ligase family protein [Cellulophaga sp. 2_MG-2023]MDO6495043.1 O-antigen ligase family protein [Cellulophaga sp. 3_MG-2023]
MLKSNNKEFIFNLANRLFFLSIIAFSLFPLIPAKFKGAPVVILIGSSIFSIIHKKEKIKGFKYALLFSSVFIIYLISLFYSDNLGIGFRKIETTLSLLLVPFALESVYLGLRPKEEIKRKFLNLFIISTTLYSASIILYFAHLGFFSGEKSLSYCLSYLNGMYYLSEHPIYVSMLIAVTIIFIFNVFLKQNYILRLLLLIGLVINIYVLFLLIRKGVIIALLFSFVCYLFYKRTSPRKVNYKVIIIGVILFLVVLFNLKSSIIKRFSELILPETYEVVNENNSTSIRYSIYKCSFSVINKKLLFGQGIGDTKDALIECYKGKAKILSKNKYNTHNQYLGVLLSIGFLGLVVFLLQLFFYLKKSLSENDTLFFQILIFFIILFFTENILERQTGVIFFSFLSNYFFYDNSNK